MFSVSLALHGAALLAGIVHSLWQVEELPMPHVQVSLVADVPPPPPPPPPPAAKPQTKPRTKPVEARPDVLVQPKETPKPDEKPREEEPQEEAGVVGGVEGGVQGGVVGGVVGGAGTAPPPAPKNTGPQMVSAGVGRRLLLINPNVDPYRVKLPRALAQTKATYTAHVQMCVSATGSVTSVQIVRGAGAAIDSQIPSVLRRWKYKPLTVDGRPTAFCFPLRYEIH